jgi:pimeloyl-ACP methyl ester carboxylesterase
VPTQKANGVNLYYELTGIQGEPIVLIHGSWSDHHSWDRVVPHLSENFRVLTFDRRGHSQSQRVSGQGLIEEDVSDLSALISELGLAPAHIAGNSLGGSIALKLAAKQPDTFRTLTIHEPPLFGLLRAEASMLPTFLEGRKRIEYAAHLLETGDKIGGARYFTDVITIGPGGWEKMSAKAREIMVENADTWLDETRDPQVINIDLEALAKFTKPTLITYGGKGMQGSKLIVEKLAKTIPNSKLEFYPDQGHTPHLSNPEEFVRRVRSFVTTSN